MRLARWIFWLAAAYGIMVLVPQYFLLNEIGRKHPPEITHSEYFYGFVGLALVWQFVFILIGREPARYRPLMIVAMFEKIAFGLPAVLLYLNDQLSLEMLGAGLIDLLLMVLFFLAWRSSRPVAQPAP
jgi:hypothetical protein